MTGKKEGLATKEEMKVLWKIASEKLPIPAILKPISNLVIPNLLDGLDNKVGDRIPEPWQTHCENLVTMVVKAVEDKVITEEEVEEIAAYLAIVLDEHIDLPLLGDDAEALIFLETMRMLAVFLYNTMKKK
jgi:hypothetical protein